MSQPKPEVGDLIICNDLLGIVIDNQLTKYIVKAKDGAKIQLSKSANIHVVANAFAISALVYNKVLSKRGK